MIHKFLVVGKQIRLSTSRPSEVQGESETVLGLTLPLDVYWQATELIKSIDYLHSTSEPGIKINEVQLAIFRLVAPYGTNDKDRTWLYDRLEGKSNASD